MKNNWMIIKKYLLWLVLLLVMDVFFCIFLWIVDVKALFALSMALILISLLFYVVILSVVVQREKKYKNAFEDYIFAPTEQNEEALVELSGKADKEIILLLGKALKEKDFVNNQLVTRITDYEEYVESWRMR